MTSNDYEIVSCQQTFFTREKMKRAKAIAGLLNSKKNTKIEWKPRKYIPIDKFKEISTERKLRNIKKKKTKLFQS